MLSELNKAAARRYFEAYHTGGIDVVMEFIDPHYVLHLGGGGEPMNFDARKRDELVFFLAFSNIKPLWKTRSPEVTRS